MNAYAQFKSPFNGESIKFDRATTPPEMLARLELAGFVPEDPDATETHDPAVDVPKRGPGRPRKTTSDEASTDD